MKKGMAAWMAALAALLMTALLSGAAAQEEMRVYIAQDTLARQTAERVVSLLREAFPQGDWTAVYAEEEGDLRALVLADRAPQLAICSPQEARPWAREGLLLALDGQTEELARIEPEVADTCVLEETLFMLPLAARCREMAVNGELVNAHGFGYLLDPVAHPVWYPSELNQLLEEFAIHDLTAVDIWLEDDGAALEAFVQAVGGGAMLQSDGTFEPGAALTGLIWLRDMVLGGLVGVAGSREEALSRFLAGETALFIDWTEEDEMRSAQAVSDTELELKKISYPTPLGVPVHAFELVGASVFLSERSAQTVLALSALRFLAGDTGAQMALGERGIDRDDAFWLPALPLIEGGGTLRGLFAEAAGSVLDGTQTPQAAIAGISGMMEAAK